MVKDKEKQGTDCYTFEVSFQGDLKNLPKQPLINEQGKKYGSVEVKEKKSTVSLVLPKFIRDNNIQPFTIMDSICLEMINCDCEKQLKQLLGFEIHSKVESIECNITQKVSGEATQSDVLNLLDHAFLTSERDNLKYVGAGKRCKYKEETHTVIVKRPHYYILKAYDKTEQQKKELKHQNQNSDTVPDGLLRIEIIYVDTSANTTALPIENWATIQATSITDNILSLSTQYDVLWDTITVDFGEAGKIVNSKSDIDVNGYARCFLNFVLE